MAWIIGGAVLGSALLGANAAGNAADTQSQAAQQAAQIAQSQYGQTRADLAPWRQAGTMALSDLSRLGGYGGQPVDMNALTSNPAYQFNLQQGQQAINKGAAARGNFYAPQTLQDIGKFSQGLASQEFGNIWNRDFQVAGMGENAAAQTGNFGMQGANIAGNALTGGANAQAAGTVGVANALTGGMSNAYNAYLMNQLLSRSHQPTIPLQGVGGMGDWGGGGGVFA